MSNYRDIYEQIEGAFLPNPPEKLMRRSKSTSITHRSENAKLIICTDLHGISIEIEGTPYTVIIDDAPLTVRVFDDQENEIHRFDLPTRTKATAADWEPIHNFSGE